MFSGHVDDHANKINSPACMRFPTYIRMPFRGMEDVEFFPLLESLMKREISITLAWVTAGRAMVLKLGPATEARLLRQI